MRSKIKQPPPIIYLLISFQGKDYTVKAELEVLSNTELYFINVSEPTLSSLVGEFFLIWRLSDGKFKYSENNKRGSKEIKESIVNAISRLIDL